MGPVGHDEQRVWAARYYRDGGQRLAWVNKSEALASAAPVKPGNPGKLRGARPWLGMGRGLRTAVVAPLVVPAFPILAAHQLSQMGNETTARKPRRSPPPIPPTAPMPATEIKTGDLTSALLLTLDHEWRAGAQARTVLGQRGFARPFTRRRDTSRENAHKLKKLLEKNDVGVPANRWVATFPNLPDSFAELCDETARTERERQAMLERFLTWAPKGKARKLWSDLLEASVSHELPALERCGTSTAEPNPVPAHKK